MAAGQKIAENEELGLTDRVRGAVLWRSGSQFAAQLVLWASTFLVIRLLDPKDYGLFAMTQVILAFLALMNGYGFAQSLVRSETVTRREISQVFGMLLLLNGALALTQIALAPLAAAYFRQPMVADLLRVQALLYLTTPFIALPRALLSRAMDFRRQGKVHLLSALVSAVTAVTGAFSGWGVWTLIAAPIAFYTTNAVGMTIFARSLVWPSFRFKGAGALFRYGSAMVVIQFFWFIQSQADVFIAGRVLTPHDLGLYTTALFLTQILTAKFIPALNEVSFAAYSQIQDRPDALAEAFLSAVRLIMLVALPFYVGLAVTAEPLVLTVLGWKWAETVPLVAMLAWAMPYMTLQILFAPATNALGKPAIAVRVAVIGAIVMPAAFLVGARYGTTGLAWSWLLGFPLLCVATAQLSLAAIGASWVGLARAVLPGLLASLGMGAAVAGLDLVLPPMAVQPRLAILVLWGACFYAALLFAFARPLVDEVLNLILRRRPAEPAQAL